ncbi:MAG: glycosyltransferase [Candidatus Fermentibacter sp.]|nr:glycosyltransferase [Candidatus Fermentibacter sp.]
MPRCDMHVHSMYSRATGYWFLRALQAPESFTPPELLYEKARDRGMDFVTITDINTIEGVMRIIDLPGTFTGEEIRTFLHGSRAAVHILAYGFDPADHDEMSRLRESFEDLTDFLSDRGIPFALAHPFHSEGPSPAYAELALAMRRCPLVEALNGSRLAAENAMVAPSVGIVRGDPGFAGFIGGSDDRCGRFIGNAFTAVPRAATAGEFLKEVASGRGAPGGASGSAIRSAYSTYSIAYSFYRERLQAQKLPLFASAAADRMFGPGRPEPPTLWQKADLALHSLYHRTLSSPDPGPESFLLEELLEIGKDLWARGEPRGEDIDERTFRIFSNTTNRLIDRLSGLLFRRITDGKFLEAFEAVSALIPVLLLNAPYPMSFFNMRRGRRAAAEFAAGTPGCSPPPSSGARAWFTDTIDDLNGVSRTLQKFSRLAFDSGRKLAVIASQERPLSFEGWVVNFPPVREFPVPDYESKMLAIPPFLDLLRFVEDNDFEALYISTPGPVGLSALLISKLLGIPSFGIYHTDLPRHVNQISRDGHMGEFAATAMGWFYSATDHVMVPSRYYMEELDKLGVPRQKMTIFPRGIDTGAFSPSWRDPGFFGRFGASEGSVRLVYVGRVSREKDLDVLAEAFLAARAEFPDIELFIVGDGPYLAELTLGLSGRGCHFCGILRGDDLSRAYASADVFVFPSTTDTFGNVVLEAAASGVPSIVTDMGGPMEIIEPGVSGVVARGRDVEGFASAILAMARDASLRKGMGEAARRRAMERTWEKAFDAVWDAMPEPGAGAGGGSGS